MASAPGKTYAQILSQIDSLRKQAEGVREKEVKGVIAKIKDAIAVYGITAADLGFETAPAVTRASGAKGKAAGGKAGAKARPARYADGTGNTWGGFGKRPDWLRAALAAGKQLSDFAVTKG